MLEVSANLASGEATFDAERDTRIGLASPPWEGGILPLNQSRNESIIPYQELTDQSDKIILIQLTLILAKVVDQLNEVSILHRVLLQIKETVITRK